MHSKELETQEEAIISNHNSKGPNSEEVVFSKYLPIF